MRKKLSTAAAVAAVAAFAVAPSSASAAHCVAPAGEEPSPGFSYFGNDHVQETDHNGAGPGQPEGGNPGPHAGTSGASNCRETTGSPSARAPGKNR
ncbi:MAG: hypothetical protein M3433_02595 [Actinomycetota bacterium]|nr:hypothetical protein [Actinomycetota bacterium]